MGKFTIGLICVGLAAFSMICGCTSIGGRRVGDASTLSGSPATPAVSDVTDVQALAAVVAKLETELNGIKSGRDSYTGLTFQGEMSVMLAILLTIVVLSQTAEQLFDRWCEYRTEMRKNG